MPESWRLEPECGGRMLSDILDAKELPQSEVVSIIVKSLAGEFEKDGNKLSDKKFKVFRRYAQHVYRALNDKTQIYPRNGM